MKTIPLTQGQVAIVDDADADRILAHKWHAAFIRGQFYARASIGGRNVYMHRFLVGEPDGLVVDHENHHALDNRRANLRVCRQKMNVANHRQANRNPATGFIGVYPARVGSRFTARAFHDRRAVYLGTFDTAEEAARIRDAEVRRLYGEFACLNFPEMS